MKNNNKRAVILLSGGLDSTTVLAIASSEGYTCYCLSFDYGQLQAIELQNARANARAFGARDHLVLRIDLDRIGGSALFSDLPLPKGRSFEELKIGIPPTYVPARNAIFLCYAAAWAENIGTGDIFIGVNVMDYSGYPDCRPEFLHAFEEMINLGTRAGAQKGIRFIVHAPLIMLTKAEIIKQGLALGVDYGQTHSCYDPDYEGRACGECDACLLRIRGFNEAGFSDPIPYRKGTMI